jgi:GNAT superfamily N-acetyltransferase
VPSRRAIDASALSRLTSPSSCAHHLSHPQTAIIVAVTDSNPAERAVVDPDVESSLGSRADEGSDVVADDSATVRAAAESIERATVADLRQVVADHERYWGERDLRALHLATLVQEFGDTCLVARSTDGIRGYLFGFVTPSSVGYVHLIATRDDARGSGLGSRLYAAFINAARAGGANRLKAITSTTNAGSIAFHRSLGFAAEIVEDYAGPGQDRVVFTRPLDLTQSPDDAHTDPRP